MFKNDNYDLCPINDIKLNKMSFTQLIYQMLKN